MRNSLARAAPDFFFGPLVRGVRAVMVRISTPEHYPGACLERQLDRV
jgi:hypothetical protein